MSRRALLGNDSGHGNPEEGQPDERLLWGVDTGAERALQKAGAILCKLSKQRSGVPTAEC